MKILLINGAPLVGKDTFGDIIINEFNYKKHKFTTPMDKMIINVFSLSEEEFKTLREKEKDIPQDCFNGLTLREVYISFSEEWAKKKFGVGFFGKMAGRYIKKNPNNYVITDCGFNSEIESFVNEIKDLPNLEIRGINLYRPNHNFNNDSREEVIFSHFNIDSDKIQNNKSKDYIEEVARNFYETFLK